MTTFLARRLLWLVITLLVASFAIYGAMDVAPGNPASLLAGGHATPAMLTQIEQQYHLNDPILVQYWRWLSGMLTGNLGQSIVYRESVSSLLAARVANTLLLVGYASVVIIIGGVALGLISALARRGGVVLTIAAGIGYGIPSFVASIVLIAVFAVDLGWFPVFGAGSGLPDQLWHLTLPAFALAVSWIAFISQLTRAAVQEELVREHVEWALHQEA